MGNALLIDDVTLGARRRWRAESTADGDRLVRR